MGQRLARKVIIFWDVTLIHIVVIFAFVKRFMSCQAIIHRTNGLWRFSVKQFRVNSAARWKIQRSYQFAFQDLAYRDSCCKSRHFLCSLSVSISLMDAPPLRHQQSVSGSQRDVLKLRKWKWLECPDASFERVEISSTTFKKYLLVVELCTIYRLALIRRSLKGRPKYKKRRNSNLKTFATAAASTNTNKAFEGLGSRKRERIPTDGWRAIGIGFETGLVRSLGRNVYFKKKMIVVRFLRSKRRRWWREQRTSLRSRHRWQEEVVVRFRLMCWCWSAMARLTAKKKKLIAVHPHVKCRKLVSKTDCLSVSCWSDQQLLQFKAFAFLFQFCGIKSESLDGWFTAGRH